MRKGVPGWTEFVSEYKNKAIFWHKLWKENGSPHTGILFDIRRKTRWEYHHILKIVKRNQDGISAQKMSDGLSGSGFWSEVKRIIGHNNSIPNTIDGVQGGEQISNLFQEKYNQLYNSVSYDTQHMAALQKEVECDIYNLSSDKCSDEFSLDDIESCMLFIKPGKGTGPGGYSSDHLINGSKSLRIHIKLLFNAMIAHGFSPVDIRLSTLVPIPKNKRKSLNDSNNYRAIALSSILGKLLDHLILVKYDNIFNTCDMQYGFKKQHGTTQCTFVVNEIIQYYLNNDSNVYVTLLDASRAFDRVNYVKLFRVLIKHKLCPVILRFLIVLYTNQSIRVQWGTSISCLCPVSNGVKQGGVLSPILFTIYFDELLLQLRDAHLGCFIGNQFCGALGYADDVVILAPTLFSLRAMLDICRKFAVSFDVLFNSSKSKLLYFGQAASRPTISPVKFMGSVIELVSHDKHLGNLIGQDCNKPQIFDAINTFNGKVNMIMSHFRHATFDVIYDIFKTYCMPLYGSQLWDYGNKYTDKFYIGCGKAIRKILNLPYTTHCELLPYICDDVHPLVQLSLRNIIFKRFVQNPLSMLCYKLALLGSCSSISNNMSIISLLWCVPR